MARLRSFFVVSLIVGGVLASARGTALASTPSSTGFLTYHDSVYGYSIGYPSTWKAVDAPDHEAIFLSPAPERACQVSVGVETTSAMPQVALVQAVPADAVAVTHESVAGAPAISFKRDPHPVPGVTAASHAFIRTVVVAQSGSAHITSLYTLSLRIYGSPSLDAAHAACEPAFHSMVASFTLPHGSNSTGGGLAPNTLSNFGGAPIQYANNTWSWWDYLNDCCQVQSGQGQPNFACAEYVARALSAEGLMPGLNPNSAQGGGVDVWDTGPTSPQNFNYYQAPSGTVYRLLDTGTDPSNGGITGLYQYLTQSSIGQDIGDNPAAAVPGDVVFYYKGSISLANLEHVTLLTVTGTTPGGNDTLVDGHNQAQHNDAYTDDGYWSNGKWYAYSRTIVHLFGNRACAASAAAPPNGGVLNASTLNVYVEGNDGNLRNFERSLPSGIWFLTTLSLNGLFINSPSGHPGGIVYAVGHDGYLHDYYGGPNWVGPTNLLPPSGVSFTCTPSSFSYTDSGGANHDIAFVTGSNGHLYDYDWSSSQGWRLTDVSNGGAFVSSPSGHPGGIVYAVGYDGHLYDYYGGPNWGGPNNLPPPSGVSFTSAPTSFSYTDSGGANHDIAFVTGSNGHLYDYDWSSSQGWRLTDVSNGGAFVSSPSGHPAATDPHNGRFVYAVGYDGHLYDYYWTGTGWGGPNNLAPPAGVAFVGSPSSFSYTVPGSSALHEIAFVVGSDGHLYSYEWVQGGGWTLTDLGNGVYAPLIGAPSAFAQ